MLLNRDCTVRAGQFLAIDCEMVGVGPEGSESTLARVSIVNYHGTTVMDKFVRPRERVTDYRTWVSGVREEDLRNGQWSRSHGGPSCRTNQDDVQ